MLYDNYQNSLMGKVAPVNRNNKILFYQAFIEPIHIYLNNLAKIKVHVTGSLVAN